MFQPVEQPKKDSQSTPRFKIKNQTMRPHDWPFAGQDITFPERASASVSRHVIGLLFRVRRAEDQTMRRAGLLGNTTGNLKALCFRRGESSVQYRKIKLREHYL